MFVFTKCRDIDPDCLYIPAQTGFPCGFTDTLLPDVSVFMHRQASHADLRIHYPRMYPFLCTDRLPVRIYGYITPGCTRFAAPTGFPRGFTGTLPPAVPVLLHRPASRADLRVHFKTRILRCRCPAVYHLLRKERRYRPALLIWPSLPDPRTHQHRIESIQIYRQR